MHHGWPVNKNTQSPHRDSPDAVSPETVRGHLRCPADSPAMATSHDETAECAVCLCPILPIRHGPPDRFSPCWLLSLAPLLAPVAPCLCRNSEQAPLPTLSALGRCRRSGCSDAPEAETPNAAPSCVQCVAVAGGWQVRGKAGGGWWAPSTVGVLCASWWAPWLFVPQVGI